MLLRRVFATVRNIPVLRSGFLRGAVWFTFHRTPPTVREMRMQKNTEDVQLAQKTIDGTVSQSNMDQLMDSCAAPALLSDPVIQRDLLSRHRRRSGR